MTWARERTEALAKLGERGDYPPAPHARLMYYMLRVRNGEPVRVKEVAEYLNVTPQTAALTLGRAWRDGLLVKKGEKKDARYILACIDAESAPAASTDDFGFPVD